MTLASLNVKLDRLRAEADSIRRSFRSSYATVRADSALSGDGKKELIDSIRSRANARLAELKEDEIKSSRAELEAAQKALVGLAGDTSGDVIGHRDAQDRADNIKKEEEAVAVLSRSLLSDDRSLTYAVLRRSLDMGWDNATEVVSEKLPSAGTAVKTIAELNGFLDSPRATFERELAYATVTD